MKQTARRDRLRRADLRAAEQDAVWRDLKNKAGEFVTPSLGVGHRRARRPRTIPDDFRFSMVNAAGQGRLPDRRRHLAARLRAAEGRRQGQEARRVSEMDAQGRREDGCRTLELRAAAGGRCRSACSQRIDDDQISSQDSTANRTRRYELRRGCPTLASFPSMPRRRIRCR